MLSTYTRRQIPQEMCTRFVLQPALHVSIWSARLCLSMEEDARTSARLAALQSLLQAGMIDNEACHERADEIRNGIGLDIPMTTPARKVPAEACRVPGSDDGSFDDEHDGDMNEGDEAADGDGEDDDQEAGDGEGQEGADAPGAEQRAAGAKRHVSLTAAATRVKRSK